MADFLIFAASCITALPAFLASLKENSVSASGFLNIDFTITFGYNCGKL
jgi:hypothetical protein